DGIRDFHVTGVQTCALPISRHRIRGMLRGSAARLAPRLTGGVNLAVVGHSTADTLLSSSRVMDVMEAVPSGAELMSEIAFQRVRSEERRVGREGGAGW